MKDQTLKSVGNQENLLSIQFQTALCQNIQDDIVIFIRHLQTFCWKNKINVTGHAQVYYMHVWGCRGHDRMVVEFTTSYAISAYHH